MSAVLSYPIVGGRPHSPSGSRLRTTKIAVDPDDAIIGPVVIEAVDGAGVVLVDSLTIALRDFGPIAGSGFWGINWFPRLGVAPTDYLIRHRFYLASNPGELAEDVTVILQCRLT